MPPKKKTTSKTTTPSKPRRSKLAKDNDLSAEAEKEIEEAWALYRVFDVEGFEDEKDGVVPTNKISVLMKALGIAPKSKAEMDEYLSILDPESDGFVTYSHFVELAAIQINNKSEDIKDEEVQKAFHLFTKGSDRPITLYDLKQIASILREDVSDDVLKAMILEANGGAGIGSGVDVEQFKQVMTRAGVFT